MEFEEDMNKILPILKGLEIKISIKFLKKDQIFLNLIKEDENFRLLSLSPNFKNSKNIIKFYRIFLEQMKIILITK